MELKPHLTTPNNEDLKELKNELEQELLKLLFNPLVPAAFRRVFLGGKGHGNTIASEA